MFPFHRIRPWLRSLQRRFKKHASSKKTNPCSTENGQEHLQPWESTLQSLCLQVTLLPLILNHQHNSRSVIKKLTESISATADIERVGVWLFNKQRSELVCADRYKRSQALHDHGSNIQVPDGSRLFNALRDKLVIASGDPSLNPWTKEIPRYCLDTAGSSSLDVAILLDGRLEGVLRLERLEPGEEWNPDKIDFAVASANLISLTLMIQQRQSMQQEIARLASFPEMSPNPVIEIDPAGNVLYLNPAGRRLFPDLPSLAQRHSLLAGLQSITIESQDNQIPAYTYEANIGDSYYEVFVHHLRIGQSQSIRLYITDITQRKQSEEILLQQAICDPLTNLYNRRYFAKRFEEEIAQAIRNQQTLALILCDLDHFKEINDSRGHQFGDEVLNKTARTLQEATRGTDLLFRWGGDEFSIILPNTTREGVLRVAERIRNRIQAICEEINTALDISIGVALFPEHGSNTDELIRSADQAIYHAKKSADKIRVC